MCSSILKWRQLARIMANNIHVFAYSLATIVRIEPELRDFITMHQAFALGDRLFWHAKACRFAERDKEKGLQALA
jgi:hypothetical protein